MRKSPISLILLGGMALGMIQCTKTAPVAPAAPTPSPAPTAAPTPSPATVPAATSGPTAAPTPTKAPVKAATIKNPSVATIADLLAKAPGGHPRLCADATTFPRVKEQAKTDPRLAGVMAAVLGQAQEALKAQPVERILEGRRLLGVSRTALRRLTALGAAWRLTGDDRYAQRADREMQAICAFKDWNPSHFLDVGEMTLALAFGYDWLYEALPETTREQIRQAIIAKGITPSYKDKPDFWVSGDNNWTQVCHAGLMAGVLAIHEQEPALAAKVVQRAIANLPKVMDASFAPDGAYPEGPGYWEYGTTFNVIAIDLLRGRFQQDFGLMEQPGFRATADYIVHVFGPTGLGFNYSDCGDMKAGCSPSQVWFARELSREWRLPAGFDPATDKGLAKERLLALALTWADPGTGAKRVAQPLDYHGGGHKPVAMFRSTWEDRNAVFLGVAGGSPSSNHGHMDVGSFVFEAKGVRWGIDLGLQEYNSLETKGVDLWNRTQDGQRWTVFRLNNLSHSTLVLGDQLQRVAGKVNITGIRTDDQLPGCTLDLTPVYAGQAKKVERRFDLPERKRLVVSDTITGLTKAGTVRWQLVTKATVAIQTDGRHARLTQDGKTLELTVAAPAEARLVVADAVGRQSYDAANPGVRILAAEVDATAGASVEYKITLDP